MTIDPNAVRFIVDRLARFLEAVEGYEPRASSSYMLAVEQPKLELADALLEALGLPKSPPSNWVPPVDTTSGVRRAVISDELRWRIFKRDGYRCVQCGSDLVLTIDHIVPIVAGGSDDESNLRTLCRTCNCSKGART